MCVTPSAAPRFQALITLRKLDKRSRGGGTWTTKKEDSSVRHDAVSVNPELSPVLLGQDTVTVTEALTVSAAPPVLSIEMSQETEGHCN